MEFSSPSDCRRGHGGPAQTKLAAKSGVIAAMAIDVQDNEPNRAVDEAEGEFPASTGHLGTGI